MSYIDTLVWERAERISPRDRAALERDLIIRPIGFQGEVVEPIVLLRQHRDADGVLWYGLPVYYGLKFFQRSMASGNLAEVLGSFTDMRSRGRDCAFPKLPTPRDSKQALFFDNLHEAARDRAVVLAEAPTGSGKTVAGLSVIAKLGKSALVICPTHKIAQQWIDACVNPSILGLERAQVGSIIGGKFDYVGKHVTVAIIHNIMRAQNIPEGLDKAFGTVIWDEAHNLAARTFSETVDNVSAVHRIALTATPTRRDRCENVFLHYFGSPGVIHTGEALQAHARVFDYVWDAEAGSSISSKPPFVRKRIVQANKQRNRCMATVIMKLYRAGRKILVLGEEVSHLQIVAGMCLDMGLDPSTAGMYTGFLYDEHGKKKNISNEALDFVAKTCNVIFATYKMGGEGLDIPRLDAGVDIFPRGSGKQSIGRIRRPLPDKPLPLWLTFRDVNITSMERMATSRLRDYRQSNVIVTEMGNVVGYS